MRTWTYPAIVTEHGPGDVSVIFPDLPEAISGGATLEEARDNAVDVLEEVVLHYLAQGEAIPSPRAAKAGEEDVPLDPVTAARVVLAQTMAEQRVTKVALAARLGKSEAAVRRLVDGSSVVKLDTVLEALALLGRRAALAA